MTFDITVHHTDVLLFIHNCQRVNLYGNRNVRFVVNPTEYVLYSNTVQYIFGTIHILTMADLPLCTYFII